MVDKMDLTESLEDYLEIILKLQESNRVARSKDIAENMGIQRGSVTSMLKNLSEKGLINYEPYGYVTLTDNGHQVALEITRKHAILKDFLARVIQIDPDKAEIIACRMEHNIDRESVDKLVKFVKFIDHCPRTGQDWIDSFVNFCSSGQREWQGCMNCLESCATRHNKNKQD